MDIVKKNLISIICGVIALVCVVLIFFPLGGMYKQVRAEVEKSAATGDSLASVAKAPRFWPTLSPKEEDKVPLKRFPTEATVKVGETITGGWTKQTSDFAETALRFQTEALKPLVPGVLPIPAGQAPAYRFQDQYRKLMGAVSLTPGGGGGAFGGGYSPPAMTGTPGGGTAFTPPAKVLGTPLIGRLPPSEAEVKDRADQREAKIRQEMPIYVNGAVQNQPQVDEAVLRARAAVGDMLREDVAKQSSVYLDPTTSFLAHDKITGATAPNANDIFIAQVGLWLQQEICRAVYETNQPALAKSQNGVIDAPIKRLIGIRFTLPYVPPTVAPGTPAPTDVPALPAAPAAKVAVDFVKNPLGQTTNDLYDVLPFTLSIVCEADTLPQTLAGLGKNRYLSIRSLDLQTVDAALARTQGFLYGTKPVVQVNIRGQYLMLRKFLGQFMPPDIIRGILAPPAAPVG